VPGSVGFKGRAVCLLLKDDCRVLWLTKLSLLLTVIVDQATLGQAECDMFLQVHFFGSAISSLAGRYWHAGGVDL